MAHYWGSLSTLTTIEWAAVTSVIGTEQTVKALRRSLTVFIVRLRTWAPPFSPIARPIARWNGKYATASCSVMAIHKVFLPLLATSWFLCWRQEARGRVEAINIKGVCRGRFSKLFDPSLPPLSAPPPLRTPDHEYGSCGNEIKSLSLIQWLWHKLCNVNLLTT